MQGRCAGDHRTCLYVVIIFLYVFVFFNTLMLLYSIQELIIELDKLTINKLHKKLVSMCPNFNKDSEACRKKCSTIYNEYKEDKAIIMKLRSQQSEKCRWYILVYEFMFDMENVVLHAHARVMNAHRMKCSITSETITI